MKIRQAHLTDAQQISEMVSQCYRRYASTDDYPQSLINELIVLRGSEDSIRQLVENESVFVSENDRQIIGMVSVHKNEITKLFVQPNVQKQGIGTLLFRHAESIINQNGFDELFLGVAVPSAMGFYEKIGLRISKIKSITRGPCKGSEIHIMSKKITW